MKPIHDRWNWDWLKNWPVGYKHHQIIDLRVKQGAISAAKRFGRKLRTHKIDDVNLEIWIDE